MHLIGQFINVKRTNRNKADSILKPQGPPIKEVNKQRSDGNGIEWNSLPFPQIICNTFFKQQLKRLAKSRNRRYCCSPQKLLQHVSSWRLNGAISWTKSWWKRWNRHPRHKERQSSVSIQITTWWVTKCCLITTCKTKIRIRRTVLHHHNHVHGTPTNKNIKSPQKKQSYNVPQKKELRKRDLKRKFTDQKPVANAAFVARKQKPVTRNPLKETHSANNIVHNDGRSAKTSFWLKRNCLYTCP